MKLLYRSEKKPNTESATLPFSVEQFTPSLLRGYFRKGEKKNPKTGFVRFYFQLMTLGKARLFYAVSEKGEVMHSSYVVPRCFKFPFLKKGDYIIGPCFTQPEFRGQGIYPKVLSKILAQMGNEQTVFYMSVDENNTPSVRGIEKAGFKRCGSVEKSRILKRYRLSDK